MSLENKDCHLPLLIWGTPLGEEVRLSRYWLTRANSRKVIGNVFLTPMRSPFLSVPSTCRNTRCFGSFDKLCQAPWITGLVHLIPRFQGWGTVGLELWEDLIGKLQRGDGSCRNQVAIGEGRLVLIERLAPIVGGLLLFRQRIAGMLPLIQDARPR